jgi:integrase
MDSVEISVPRPPTRASRVRRKVKLAFTDDDGQPLHRSTLNTNVWRPACDRAADALRALADKERDKEAGARLRRLADAMADVTMHDLRHFFASALIRGGLNVKVVSERLGHANAVMTLNVYSHLWPDDEDRTRQAIDEVFKIQPDAPRLHPASGSLS